MADGQGTPSPATRSKGRSPRVAFTGEEFGFGYQATEAFVRHASRFGHSDGGWKRKVFDQELDSFAAAASQTYNFTAEQRLPLRSKEQALMAVKSGTADFAVVPFYHPYFGYDFETLRALSSLFALLGVEQYEATDKLCLAVYEPQVLDIVQSAHPGSGLSSLLKHDRKSWGTAERVRGPQNLDVHLSGEQYRAGLAIDQAQQMMLRDRIDVVFAGPEAARRCKSKLDGLRAAGVDIKETLATVEPHREMARLARASLNPNRQTNTFFDPRSGQTHFVSTLGAEAQAAKLYGVILPFQVAMMSHDFTIIDPDIEDAEQPKTRFMVVTTSPDETLTEDAYKTTDAKTRYWMGRLRSVLRDAQSRAAARGEGANPGVRMMLKFQRAGEAASIGDVENYLRNFGVRHTVVRLDEDSERANPAAVLLDVEFCASDFEGDIAWSGLFGTIASRLTRRAKGSIAGGALKLAFQRWKQRAVWVAAAMPFETPQLPPHKRRTWWGSAVQAWFEDATETAFIRMSRLLIVYVMPAIVLGALAYYLWKQYAGG